MKSSIWHYICWYNHTVEVKRYSFVQLTCCNRPFWLIVVSFYGLTVIPLLFLNHLKELLSFALIYKLSDVRGLNTFMKPWSQKCFKLDSFNDSSYHLCICVLSTLGGNVDNHSPLYMIHNNTIYNSLHPGGTTKCHAYRSSLAWLVCYRKLNTNALSEFWLTH